MRAAPFVIVPLLAACGKDPVAACEDYFAASDACRVEALGPDSGGQDPTAFCAAHEDLKGDDRKVAVEAYQCAAAAFDDADCSTADGFNQAAADAGVCLDTLPE